jgi:hypothetical protein
MAGLVRTSITSCGWVLGDLVLDSLLTRLVGPLDDELKALAVLKKAGIEFCLDGA